jgi:hypothetical protein
VAGVLIVPLVPFAFVVLGVILVVSIRQWTGGMCVGHARV